VSAQQGDGRSGSRLCEKLVVSPGIRNNHKSRVPKGCLDLVSESSRSEVAYSGSDSSGKSKLQHSLLARGDGGKAQILARFAKGTRARATSRSSSQILFTFSTYMSSFFPM